MNSLQIFARNACAALRCNSNPSGLPVFGSRFVHCSVAASHGGAKPEPGEESMTVTFVEADGKTEQTVQAKLGTSLLEVAHTYDIDLEGACEGSLACSTCHVIVKDQAMFDKLGEICDDEADMLDLAFGLTQTSRLGCQVICSKDLEGLRVALPSATRNFAVDGFKPKPH
mmetsp:Transcript_35370/g.67656  ORF Transcript_35370/g.67656 Transcript_35370/m.67656 type:complete len:170 (-) Transcript_35370:187-696(-)